MQTESLLNKFSLSERNFVVTGASSGLGRSMAVILAQAGASVVLVARREAELEQVANEIRAFGGKAGIVPADLCERENLGEIAERCKAVFAQSAIDGVVNAAGVNLREPVDEVSLESWDFTLNLN